MHQHLILRCLKCSAAWFGTAEPWPCQCRVGAVRTLAVSGKALDDCDCTPERLVAATAELLS